MSDIKVLTDYFNSGPDKKGFKEWSGELKALTPAEKTELADLIRALPETGPVTE